MSDETKDQWREEKEKSDGVTEKELKELGGEMIEGSGFENEIPEDGWR